MANSRLLVVSQMFWPDEVAVAQIMADFARYLDRHDVQVTVFCSRHAYENSGHRFPARERLGGIRIERIPHFGFGKRHALGRVLDIASFNVMLFLKLLCVRRASFDAVLGLTNPPLASFFGVLAARLKRIPFHYWVMDIQPEMAIRSGVLDSNSVVSKALLWMSAYIVRQAAHVIVLDRFMKQYAGEKTPMTSICTVPVWPVVGEPELPDQTGDSFRRAHDLQSKIVVMYSGNISQVHPLDTLLRSALALSGDDRFRFVFIGQGTGCRALKGFIEKHGLKNTVMLPYQTRASAHESLGAADLHVVTLGEKLVGLTHPCKVYSVMVLARPVVYIGPRPSHVSELLAQSGGNIEVRHGDTEHLTDALRDFADRTAQERADIGHRNRAVILAEYTAEQSMQKLKAAVLGH